MNNKGKESGLNALINIMTAATLLYLFYALVFSGVGLTFSLSNLSPIVWVLIVLVIIYFILFRKK